MTSCSVGGLVRSSSRTKFEPMKPQPPVTRTRRHRRAPHRRISSLPTARAMRGRCSELARAARRGLGDSTQLCLPAAPGSRRRCGARRWWCAHRACARCRGSGASKVFGLAVVAVFRARRALLIDSSISVPPKSLAPDISATWAELLSAQLHPGDLDVGDPGSQEEPATATMRRSSGSGGARPRAVLVVERGVVVDEAERDELGEAAGLLLDVRSRSRGGRRCARARLDVAVHHGRGLERRPTSVGGGHDLDPALGHELAGRHDLFAPRRSGSRRPCPGWCPSPGVLEHAQVVVQRPCRRSARCPKSISSRRERVDVQLGELGLDGPR